MSFVRDALIAAAGALAGLALATVIPLDRAKTDHRAADASAQQMAPAMPSPPATPSPAPSQTPAPTPIPESVTVSPTPEMTPELTPTPTPELGKWVINRNESSMDDSPRVVAALQSENQETSNGYSSNYAALIVRCQERETEVYINVNTFIGSDNGRVRYRLDDQKAQDVTWGISTDFKAFFVRGAIAFAKKLAAGETLVMRFTPYGDSPQEFRFDVRGLRPHLAEIAKACGWKP